MTRQEFDLNISYRFGESGADDGALDALAEANGFERTGSGGGFGLRDIHYSRATPLTEIEKHGMIAVLQALTFPLVASIETWTYNENDEPVGDTTGEDLIDTLTEAA